MIICDVFLSVALCTFMVNQGESLEVHNTHTHTHTHTQRERERERERIITPQKV